MSRIVEAIDVLDLALRWLRDPGDLDEYQLSIVENSRVHILDAIANLEGIL